MYCGPKVRVTRHTHLRSAIPMINDRCIEPSAKTIAAWIVSIETGSSARSKTYETSQKLSWYGHEILAGDPHFSYF